MARTKQALAGTRKLYVIEDVLLTQNTTLARRAVSRIRERSRLASSFQGHKLFLNGVSLQQLRLFLAKTTSSPDVLLDSVSLSGPEEQINSLVGKWREMLSSSITPPPYPLLQLPPKPFETSLSSVFGVAPRIAMLILSMITPVANLLPLQRVSKRWKWLINQVPATITATDASRAPSLHLTLPYAIAYETPPTLTSLPHMDYLRSLTLTIPEFITTVPYPNLTHLSFTPISPLEEEEEIKSVQVPSYLSRLTNIEHLDLKKLSCDAASIGRSLRPLTKLRVLEVPDFKILLADVANVSYLQFLPHLHTLVIDDTIRQQDELNVLARLPLLRSLSVTLFETPQLSFERLPLITHLQLNLLGHGDRDQKLPKGVTPRLQSLTVQIAFTFRSFTDRDWPTYSLPHLTQLVTLNISSKGVLSLLEGSDQIRELSILQTGQLLPAEIEEELRGLSSLRSLTLSGTGDELLAICTALTNLETLSLPDHKLTSDDLRSLSSLRRLYRLNVSEIYLSSHVTAVAHSLFPYLTISCIAPTRKTGVKIADFV